MRECTIERVTQTYYMYTHVYTYIHTHRHTHIQIYLHLLDVLDIGDDETVGGVHCNTHVVCRPLDHVLLHLDI